MEVGRDEAGGLVIRSISYWEARALASALAFASEVVPMPESLQALEEQLEAEALQEGEETEKAAHSATSGVSGGVSDEG